MARIACLSVRGLPIAALLRMEPDLRGERVAITAGRTARSVVEAVSTEARAAGVALGMTAAQARAVCRTIVIRPASTATVRAAAEAVADVAATVAGRVEVEPDGTVFLDCTGTAALCASEAELATILTVRAERQGLAISVGIGDSKLAARIAARDGEGARIVPTAATREFLAPLPIRCLEPDTATAAILRSWGVERIGQLAAFHAGAVAHRLGPAGARLIRRARGEDDDVLVCRPAPVAFSEAVQLDDVIERIEPLLFLLRRLLDCMIARFALHGLVCASVEIALDFDGSGHDARQIAPAAPTADAKVLLTLIRADIEHRPPLHGIVGLAVHGVATRLRPTQLDFFEPSGPSPTALAAMIARLAALCGPDRVGTPVRPASHRPEAFTLTAFPGALHAAEGSAQPGRDAVASAESGDEPPVTRIALRAFRPPVALEVFANAGRLDYIRGRGLGGRVVHLAGPWRLRGEWWTAEPCVREYYDVELSDGGVYRIYREVDSDRWLADGTYD